MKPRKNIFVIYTSKDNGVMLRLMGHLAPFEKDFNISIWYDDLIYPNQQWKPQNESRFDQADIFLLLVSNEFMHSEFVKQLEFKTIIDRYKEGKTTVIPIILDDCPWNIDFEADEYTFNFKELNVLPDGGKPIKSFPSEEKAFEKVTAHIKKIVALISGITVQEEPTGQDMVTNDPDEELANSKIEDQLAMSFAEEEAEAKRKKIAEEERLKEEEAEAKNKAEEERKSNERLKARQKAKEEQRLRKEAEAKRIAEEEQRRLKEAETKRMAEEEKRLREEESKAWLEEEREFHKKEEAYENMEDENPKNNKKILWGGLATAVVIIGIIAFSMFDNESNEDLPSTQEEEVVTTKNPMVDDEPETIATPEKKTLNAAATLKKLAIGNRFESGIIFEIDAAGKTGKIAHVDDFGPMTWSDAMKIHEELGDGWRVPTLDELKTMYQTIGNGSDNTGEFANGLYWSATPYDDYQARLLRFSDGNSSYHYNSGGTHRKFLVRAIRDFSR